MVNESFLFSLKMKRQNIRTLSLVVCTFTYLLVGAAVFDKLESETEATRWEFLKAAKDNFYNKYNMTEEDYRMLEIVIIENKPHKAGPQWKFAGAFYFATVVLAMIGYGHSTPNTNAGKLFCMIYAMVGIPLGLVMFQSIGERLNKFASVIIRRFKIFMKCSHTEATEINLMAATGFLSSVRIKSCLVVETIKLIIFTGAAVFSRYEGWSYFDSLYYCFGEFQHVLIISRNISFYAHLQSP
jgi:potassium channel subfamily K member 9